MTDPKCHKVNSTYVTEVEHGESSFASCFDSDDESTSSDNEDDSDDYLSHLHKNNSIGTWATKNGYNLTTFDQLECRGKWSNDLPLPLPMWAKKSKPALVIDTVSLLLKELLRFMDNQWKITEYNLLITNKYSHMTTCNLIILFCFV